MDSAMYKLDAAYPVIHAVLFMIGVVNNLSLLVASFLRTPKMLKNYSIIIKIGTFNDLLTVLGDFFTKHRLIVSPGNMLYLSLGPCSWISPRACYLACCMQMCVLIYSMYVMAASFAYRLWILHFSPPSARNVIIVMILLCIPPASVALKHSFEQADLEVVQKFLLENAPSYLTEPGALSGTSGMTYHLIFTILFLVFTPGPIYVIVMILRHKILARLAQHSDGMSDRTRKMHRNLVKALTVHAMLPPISCISVAIYLILLFDIYRHVALEKAIFTVAAIPPAVGALCTTYYVEPYRRFVFCHAARQTPKTSTESGHGVQPSPAAAWRDRAGTL